MKKPIAFSIAVLLCLLILSCNKEGFISTPDARVIISADSLKFDTVFTTTGSTTQLFTIRNDNDQKLLISKVLLKGGLASPFKMNVDGIAAPEVSNIEIEAKDSIYVFVTVSVPSNASNLPFVVNDSIIISYNGSEKKVQLETWGQNANFLRGRLITGNVTWTNNRPYVILDGLQVDTGATLTIEKGCRIYMHANAPFVVDGTLKVNGEKYDSTKVYFSGDRLDDPYRNFPAAWPGIYFRGSSIDNVLNYAVVSNGYQGVVAERLSLNANPRVSLNECTIQNIYDAGLLGIQTSIRARNCLIANCGKNIQMVYGGKYDLLHCTIATYNSLYINHDNPVLFVSNNAKQDNTVITADLSATFKNCIFWGEGGKAEGEIVVSRQGTNAWSVVFENCLWKVKATPQDVSASGIIANQDPVFDSINTDRSYYNFRLKETSPAINKGVVTAITTDLDGNNRAVGMPDLGAYEKQ